LEILKRCHLSPIERPAQKERIQGGFGTEKSSAPLCELLSRSRSLFAGVAHFFGYNLKAFDARLKQHNPTFQLYSICIIEFLSVNPFSIRVQFSSSCSMEGWWAPQPHNISPPLQSQSVFKADETLRKIPKHLEVGAAFGSARVTRNARTKRKRKPD
jgi:hypothetical protein